MRIYTIQAKDFLHNLDSEGYVLPKEVREETSIFFENPNALGALGWMKDEYEKRIGLPLDRDFIWMWEDTVAYEADVALGYFDSSKYSLYVFDIPKEYEKNVLWSDFVEWHLPLNHDWEEGLTSQERKEFEEIFTISETRQRGDIQGITTRLHSDWLVEIIKEDTYED